VNVADELDLDFGASEPAAGGLSELAARRRVIDLTAPLAERLIRLARLPVLRSLTRRLLSVLNKVLA